MSPDRVEFNIGQTRFGQPLRLVFEKGSDGQRGWTLHRDAADQRDDSTFISGLDRETILRMAEAVNNQDLK